jgi:hypothetical protein
MKNACKKWKPFSRIGQSAWVKRSAEQINMIKGGLSMYDPDPMNRGSRFFFIKTIFCIVFLCVTTVIAPLNCPAGEKFEPKQIWSELHKRSTYPYTLPLPSPKRTSIDGTYTRTIPLKEAHVPCKRCPDWLPEGGVWKISFSKGTYRIIHEETSWHTIGSFFVAGDRIILANDPVCHDVIGMYQWKLEGDKLTLKLIDDECGIRLRAANLILGPWLSCRPPNREAAITEHWPKPDGC